LSTGSTVYACADVLDKHCIDAGPMLDKKRSSSKKALSAQLFLWICRAFSTDDPVFLAFWRSDAFDVDIQDMSPAVAHVLSFQHEARSLSCLHDGCLYFFR
jgi:hypothetical protein